MDIVIEDIENRDYVDDIKITNRTEDMIILEVEYPSLGDQCKIPLVIDPGGYITIRKKQHE